MFLAFFLPVCSGFLLHESGEVKLSGPKSNDFMAALQLFTQTVLFLGLAQVLEFAN